MAEAVPPLEAEEAAWAKAAAAGDRGAFGRLYRRFAPVVHGILLAAVGPERAEDLVSEVFLRALRHLDEVRSAGAIAGWLCTIARNAAKDAYRAARAVEPLPEELPGARAGPSGEASEILAVVRGLPPAYRETLVLRLVEGLSGPEIALRTGLTPGSVRVNLCRGMKILSERLAEKGWS